MKFRHKAFVFTKHCDTIRQADRLLLGKMLESGEERRGEERRGEIVELLSTVNILHPVSAPHPARNVGHLDT